MNDSIRDVLLAQRGIAFVEPTDGNATEDTVRAIELELAHLGYVVSTELRVRLAACSIDRLSEFRNWAIEVLAKHVGGNQKHVPLFRSFPDGIPDDTLVLWWDKVLVHYLQAADQPCLFCGCTGTTHVLNPCLHVVCNQCFDGANYSACPVCEHHVDQSSPFFQPAPERALPNESVRFKRLSIGIDEEFEARRLFLSFCDRQQAMSQTDRDALVVTIRCCKDNILEWLPEKIAVRENMALVFGTLFQVVEPAITLVAARRYLKTATDVLRLIAALSGADASLQPETIIKYEERLQSSNFWKNVAKLIGAATPGPTTRKIAVPVKVSRFKMAKLSRGQRRAILELLNEIEKPQLIEDMLRHRSYWVWVGEFLHPGEYATRFPIVAEAFHHVRRKSPDGRPAPKFRSWNSRLEASFSARDFDVVLKLLSERPGELARRFDFAVRLAGNHSAKIDRIVSTFVENIQSFSLPVLLLLQSYLPTRVQPADVRIYWPKGSVAKGVSAPDKRKTLPREVIEMAVRAIDQELLRRFADKPPLADCIVDEKLRAIPVPFNERTASPSAISLPRGSVISLPAGKFMRMFLHWCQPPQGGHTTDLDLSVGLYDRDWRLVGVCSYYELQCKSERGDLVAQSSGDLRDAPAPDGATEFVDLHLDAAKSAGAAFAVMVVNNYCGMPFSTLERGFAGVMLRDDPQGKHFDPRTVHLKFSLSGENGIFMPLVIDLTSETLHWLDVQSTGQFSMNNVETSNASISKVCPELIAYFSSGVRPNMFNLALLHAAARAQRVVIRGDRARCIERSSVEDPAQFYRRLVEDFGVATSPPNSADFRLPLLAVLHDGDVSLPQGADCYALFREAATTTMAAADLL